jgi:hypothetical protein
LKRSLLAPLLALAFFASMSPPTAHAVGELTPDLIALDARQLRIETTGSVSLLRFTTTSWNAGAGPFELFAEATPGIPTNGAKVQAYQRIYLQDGGFVDQKLEGVFFEWHADGGHDHFHLSRYAYYELVSTTDPSVSPRTGEKTSFCIIDTDRVNHRLPGAPKRPHYTQCGTSIQGMSVGWGDSYGYWLEGQSIDVSGLPDGQYTLAITIDPESRFSELDASNNQSQLLISISGGTVSIVDEGGGSAPGYCRQHPERDGCP